LRPNGQRWVYDFVNAWKRDHPSEFGPVVVMCHRHLGKTTWAVTYGFERCILEPSNVIYICPKANQAQRNLRQPLKIVLKDAPKDIRIRWRGPEATIRNPAWKDPAAFSTFQFLGSDKDGGNHIRGCGGQNLIIVDEARDAKNLKSLIEDVLIFSFQKQKNPLLVLITTPPASLDHDLIRAGGYGEIAMRAGSYYVVPASKNPDYSKHDKMAILACCGGDETSDFYRREAECELFQDESRATVPEYGRRKHFTEVESYERPSHFFPMIVADLGWEPDPTAILVCYLDWQQQVIVFEDERIIPRCSTRDFAEAVNELEEFHFKGTVHPVRRFADCEPRLLDDLYREHRLRVQGVPRHHTYGQPYDQNSALQRLRTVVGDGRMRILPRARQLRYQMLTGLLNHFGKLERSERLGHQDATAAAIYAVRVAPWNVNPYPTPIIDEASNFSPSGWGPSKPGLLVKTPAAEIGSIRRLPGYVIKQPIYRRRGWPRQI